MRREMMFVEEAAPISAKAWRSLEFTAEQVRKKLWTGLSSKRPSAHSQLTLAKAIGISPQYLNDILHGNREPCEKCLQWLGLEKVVVYRVAQRRS